ncbi:MAG: HAD-IC family P-type ATPase [Thermodesulfobacteriota bacterium]
MSKPWYQQDTVNIIEQLETSNQGLTEAVATSRLQQYGPNRLAEEGQISRLRLLLHQFTSPLIYILMLAAVVTFFLQEYKDTGVIVAVIILNAVIGYTQELKAEKNVRALKKLIVPRARVIRESREQEIDSEHLVPGDMVVLASGSKVPADLRLIKTLELRVDEAMLTGESLPVEKNYQALSEENLTSGDQVNMAFMGTVVVHGRARGVVVETGQRTVLGQIATQVQEALTLKAPLQEKFDRFARTIGLLVLIASGILFAAGILMGENIKEMFMTVVAAAVAAIPEGLPVVVTITLAIGVTRMARRNAIVRRLPAVETLGSTTVIGSDKTGTLTKNEMTVKEVFAGDHVYELTGEGYDPKGEILSEWLAVDSELEAELKMVFRIGLLCNESDVYEEDGVYKVDGDPTEGALIVSALKAGLDTEKERASYPQLDIIPFESDRGYMATLHEQGGKKWMFVKGAPEKLFDICSTCSGGPWQKVGNISENFAREGLRVLAMAYKEVPPETEELTHELLETGLVFAGLQGMMDPPRPEVIGAIEGCRKAGIRVVMITGDHAITAKTIARKLGVGDRDPEVLTGRELETMSDDELFQRVPKVSVYARVSPHHKLRITQQLIQHRNIVAVTGDGVNDAPALKAAHIGVAMGKSGTDVAREASDMVLADDNFTSIFNAVEEGRIVFDNLRKVTFFLIPTGIAAILSILGSVLFGLPLPYLPAQLLWINLVSNGLQDVALAFEPGEKGVLLRPPRNPKEGIMSRILIERTILVSLLISIGVLFEFWSALDQGVSLEKARTIAMTVMVFFQFFQAWNSRSEIASVFRISPFSNPFLFYGMVAAVLSQLAVIYVPGLQWIFRTESISGNEWLRILLIALTVVIVVEADKWWRRRSSARL